MKWKEDNDEMGTILVKYGDKCVSAPSQTG